METIKEAIEEHILFPPNPDEVFEATEQFLYGLQVAGFIQGVVWSERWIPVEEELPDNQDIVLVKTDKGCVSTAYLHGKESGFICYGDHGYSDFGKITYWRPINHE